MNAEDCLPPGYHLRDIPKGQFGELSKIREEIEEALEADEQGVELMVLQELSDVLASIDGYLEKHHPSLDLDDLVKMARATRRAFKNGHRT